MSEMSIGHGVEYQKEERLPLMTQEALTAVVEADRMGEWYELSFEEADASLAVQEAVLANFPVLAEYCKRFGVFIVATATTTPNGRRVWTFMPAFHKNDRSVTPGVRRKAEEAYKDRLVTAQYYAVVDPGESEIVPYKYDDTEQIGIKNAHHPMYITAFDVSISDGIRWDECFVARGTLRSEEKGWIGWGGGSIYSMDTATGGAVALEAR